MNKEISLLSGHLTKSLLIDNCNTTTRKLLNPDFFLKEIFYLFEYAAVNENEYYNHLAFSYIEDFLIYLSKVKMEQANWSIPFISLYFTKFNEFGYFNLSISSIYEKADHICKLILLDKKLKPTLFILALIYFELKEKKSLELEKLLKKNRQILNGMKIFEQQLSFDELIRNLILVKILSQYNASYSKYISLGLDSLLSVVNNREKSTGYWDKLLFVFEEIIDSKYHRSTVFLEIISSKSLLKRNEKRPGSEQFEKDISRLSIVDKFDLGFAMLMSSHKNNFEKKAYYMLLR